MKLLFASSNVNKVNEIRKILPKSYALLTLEELGFCEDLEETGNTLEDNALQKAHFISQRFNINCFADDSGLEVDYLCGAPGLHSAYYAGIPRNTEKNMEVLLKNMAEAGNRKARFRTVIALMIDGNEMLFEGILNGRIARSPAGSNGFGYDPVFIPEGYEKTLAELEPEVKSQISHRSIALNKLISFLDIRNSEI